MNDIKPGDIFRLKNGKMVLLLDVNDSNHLKCSSITDKASDFTFTVNDKDGQVFFIDTSSFFTTESGCLEEFSGNITKNDLETAVRKIIENITCAYFNIVQNKNKDYIGSSGKVLDSSDLYGMIDACLDLNLTISSHNEKFERSICDLTGRCHCLTTNSGSSANLIAVSALCSYRLGDRRLNPGDEVITLAASFPTTVTPIIQNGLIPVFIDIAIAQVAGLGVLLADYLGFEAEGVAVQISALAAAMLGALLLTWTERRWPQ